MGKISGGTGPTLQSWWGCELGKPLQFKHLRVLLPTAAPIYYTPAQSPMHAWIDRLATDITAPELPDSIDAAVDSLTKLIDAQVADGIPLDRILIGGFSMGGSLALHVCYRSRPGLAGVFALSSFLNHGSIVYSALDSLDRKDESFPPLFQSHGTSDTLVLHGWGRETSAQLSRRGVKAEFHSIPDSDHELHPAALQPLHAWIAKRLPPVNHNSS